ncbi:MAG: DUF3631 domain-containing protein [Pseudomonadota bacterium]
MAPLEDYANSPNDLRAAIPNDCAEDTATPEGLATLSPQDYEKLRKREAKRLGIRVAALDRMVDRHRKTGKQDQGKPPMLPEVEPWPERIDGEQLLGELRDKINRYCILPEHSDVLIAVWIMHAHAHDCADISPILCLTSPEKRCGKSTAAKVVGALVPKPLHTISVTPAALFRAIENCKPTVIIDEGDTFLRGNEAMRGLLNGGHDRQTANVLRTVGDSHELQAFPVWAPKVLAMIGTPRDTIVDRSLMVPLRRKTEGEATERFTVQSRSALAHLSRKACRWVLDHRSELERLNPDLPDELNDRAQDNARPLCAIADIVGGCWPEIVRQALIASAQRQRSDETQTEGVRLLKDIRGFFERTKKKSVNSTELHQNLISDEESPWIEHRNGKPISPKGISTILGGFGIRSRRNSEARYYQRSDFADAFSRYLADDPT